MSENLHVFELLNAVLSYPDQHYHRKISECRRALESTHPEAADLLRVFEADAADKTVPQLEEMYIQTFDMNKTCTLDLGWPLFGEDYNRGLFLVKLRQEMRRLDVKDSTELPDHVTNVLAILGRMDFEAAKDFAHTCVVPALKKTHEGMIKESPYRFVIEGLLTLLETQFGQLPDEAYHV